MCGTYWEQTPCFSLSESLVATNWNLVWSEKELIEYKIAQKARNKVRRSWPGRTSAQNHAEELLWWKELCCFCQARTYCWRWVLTGMWPWPPLFLETDLPAAILTRMDPRWHLFLCNTCFWFKTLFRCVWLSGPVLEPRVLVAKEVGDSPNAGSMLDYTEKFRKSGPQWAPSQQLASACWLAVWISHLEICSQMNAWILLIMRFAWVVAVVYTDIFVSENK